MDTVAIVSWDIAPGGMRMVTPAFLISNIPPDDSNVLVRIGSVTTISGSKGLVTGGKSKETY